MKRAIFQVICFIGTAISILAACTSPSKSLPTESPTNFHIEILPSSTNTARLTTVPKPTSPNTATPRPNSIAALPSEFDIPKSCLPAHIVSNDRNWFAGDCPLYKELIISNKTSGKQIEIRYKEIDPGFPDNFSTQPLSWASDNRDLYFTTRCCNSDDGDNANGALYRLEVEKVSWNVLIKPVNEPLYFFSSDGERYIYLNHYISESEGIPEHLEIGMVDVLLNKNKRVVLRYYWGPLGRLGEKPNYEWSQTSDKFAIVLDRVNLHPDSVTLDPVLLVIDFNYWAMEILDEFSERNLLEE